MVDSFIPYGKPSVDEEDIAAVVSVLQSDFLTTGPVVGQFEEALSHQVSVDYVTSCSSGTAALHLACASLSISPDDQIIVPAMTFCATANAVAMVGGEVIFSDVNPKTGLMEPADLKKAISRSDLSKLKAIMVVHMNGQVVDIVAIKSIADAYGLKIIEDAAHALGSSYSHEGVEYQIGSCAHSDLCCFSFHPVKNIAMGEGGAICTNSETYADFMKSFRNHGCVQDEKLFVNLPPDAVSAAPMWHREMRMLGNNYRASDINCALAKSQLTKLQDYKAKRAKLVKLYDDAFGGEAAILNSIDRIPDQEPCWHLYPLLLDFHKLGMSREALMAKLKRKNIGTQVHYMPVSWHPYWQVRTDGFSYDGAAQYYENILSLPLFSSLSETEAGYVASTLLDILKEA